MRDPFEESLRDMLNAQPARDDDACLDRVLKTANRQVGAGDLFGLMGHWLQTVLIAFSSGAPHASAVTRRRSSSHSSFDKAD
ncbi:CrfX protein [Stutzerimonas stutzeri]|uniref:CrfX protein n=1 Tax=Stutzerimonas stutzeri TaxID=316 RepID=A0A6I6LWZ6_STUST|nr:CrfX protein [Stutzerimonas stutzeri]QGZ30891.1 CrfX protein [Stutzerimonas stutzeri]